MLTGVTSPSKEIGSLLPVAKQELKRLVTLGARCLLDGVVEEADWSARMVQDSGPLIHRIAAFTATSTEDTLNSIRHHAERIVVLMRSGERLAACAWIGDYAKKIAGQIEEHGGWLRDEEDMPDGWEELCKHPATQQRGETLALIICGLVSLAFFYLLFTNPRMLLASRLGVLIGIVGLFTLAIAALIIFVQTRSAFRRFVRRRHEHVSGAR